MPNSSLSSTRNSIARAAPCRAASDGAPPRRRCRRGGLLTTTILVDPGWPTCAITIFSSEPQRDLVDQDRQRPPQLRGAGEGRSWCRGSADRGRPPPRRRGASPARAGRRSGRSARACSPRSRRSVSIRASPRSRRGRSRRRRSRSASRVARDVVGDVLVRHVEAVRGASKARTIARRPGERAASQPSRSPSGTSGQAVCLRCESFRRRGSG